MTAIARVVRVYGLAQFETLCVSAITGLALVAGFAVIFHYGSFARALAALGLAPAH